MTAKILPFKIEYISVVACCENCAATWIAHMRERDYQQYLEGVKKMCPYCNAYGVYYCRRC